MHVKNHSYFTEVLKCLLPVLSTLLNVSPFCNQSTLREVKYMVSKEKENICENDLKNYFFQLENFVLYYRTWRWFYAFFFFWITLAWNDTEKSRVHNYFPRFRKLRFCWNRVQSFEERSLEWITVLGAPSFTRYLQLSLPMITFYFNHAIFRTR